MDWEVIGAIAEVVSAVGVVGSLVYLAIQIRGSNRESRIAANGEIAREYNLFLKHLSDDWDRQSLWIRVWGSSAEAKLTKEEQNYVILLSGMLMRVLENAFLQFQAGRMEESSWDPYFQTLRRGAMSPSLNLYLDMRGDMHTKEFVALLRSVQAAPGERQMFS